MLAWNWLMSDFESPAIGKYTSAVVTCALAPSSRVPAQRQVARNLFSDMFFFPPRSQCVTAKFQETNETKSLSSRRDSTGSLGIFIIILSWTI